MNARHLTLTLLVPAILASCEGNPVAPVDDHEDLTADLNVEVVLSASHVHTLSELTFTVTVTDHHGNYVTDFDTLRMERREEGADTWRATNLTLQGTSYVGSYTFMSSGQYHLRVAGRRGHDAAMVDMHAMSEMLKVARAHVEAGGYRIEFESFPGHLHEHDVGTMTFWVMEAQADAGGNRPAVTGLSPDIHCLEADGTEEEHAAAESTAGTYQADHTFLSSGVFVAALHFTGADGAPAEASFTFSVAHGH